MAFRVTITVRIVSMVKAFHREARRRQPAWPGRCRGHHGLGPRGPLSPPRASPPRYSREGVRRVPPPPNLSINDFPETRPPPEGPGATFGPSSWGRPRWVFWAFPTPTPEPTPTAAKPT